MKRDLLDEAQYRVKAWNRIRHHTERPESESIYAAGREEAAQELVNFLTTGGKPEEAKAFLNRRRAHYDADYDRTQNMKSLSASVEIQHLLRFT